MKLDWRPNEQGLFHRPHFQGPPGQSGRQQPADLLRQLQQSPFQNGVINWTRTISPNMVNEARFGVNNVMLV